MNTVHVVGLGMSPADLTPGVLEIIREAQVLVGGRRLLDYFPDHPAKKIPLGKDPEGVLQQLRDLAATSGWWCWPPGTPISTGWPPWW